MKTYVITFSINFPKGHPKAGEPTFFVEKIARREKKHTIRVNAEWWMKIIGEVQRGEAELSLRYWSAKPYASPQVEFGRLGKEEGVNAQLLEFREGNIYSPIVDKYFHPESEELAKNDGLFSQDWLDWFKNYKLNKPMVIINLGKWYYADIWMQ